MFILTSLNFYSIAAVRAIRSMIGTSYSVINSKTFMTCGVRIQPQLE